MLLVFGETWKQSCGRASASHIAGSGYWIGGARGKVFGVNSIWAEKSDSFGNDSSVREGRVLGGWAEIDELLEYIKHQIIWMHHRSSWFWVWFISRRQFDWPWSVSALFRVHEQSLFTQFCFVNGADCNRWAPQLTQVTSIESLAQRQCIDKTFITKR